MGDAFLDIHANTSPFKTELAAGVRAAITEAEAASTVRVRAATGGLADTTTTNTVRTVSDDASAVASAKAAMAEIRATVDSEAIQERAIAAETASIETQYRQAVAAAAKAAYAETQATVESEAIAERAASAATLAAIKADDAAKAASAKAASAEQTKAATESAAAQKKVFDAAATAAKVAIAGAALTTIAVGASAVKNALDLQIAVQKVINLSSGQLNLSAKQITQQVIDTSNATGVAAADIANAFYKIAAAGKPAAEATDILNASSKSAAIGLGDATTVADELVAAINVYGDANLSAAKAADVFLAASQNSKFGPDELGKSIGRILPLAHDIGISIQDLGASLAALSHAGFNADQSVTGLQAVSSNLIKGTAATGGARKEFDALHLSAQNLITDIGTHGLVAALGEINTALHNSGDAAHNTQAQYQDLANNLGVSVQDVIKQFGHFDLTQLQKIFPNRKALITFLGLTDDANTAAQQAYQNVLTVQPGTLDKAFLGFKGSVAGKIKIGINSIKDDIIGLGNALLPTVASVIQKIQDTISQAKDPTSQLHKFLVTLGQDIKDIAIIAVPLLKGVAGAFVEIVNAAKPFLDILATIASSPAGSKLFEFAGGIAAVLLAAKGITGVLVSLRALAALLPGVGAGAAVARAGVVGTGGAAAVANPYVLALVASLVAARVAYQNIPAYATAVNKVTSLGSSLWNDLRNAVSGHNVAADEAKQKLADTAAAAAQAATLVSQLTAAFKLTGLSEKDAKNAADSVSAAFGRGTSATQSLITQLRGAGDTSAQVITVLEGLGISADNANAAVNGMDFTGADNALIVLYSNAILAANGIAAASQAAAAFSQFPSAASANAHKGVSGAGLASASNPTGAIVKPISPLTGASPTATGGGGASKAATAAQTAAANFASSITSALSTLSDAIASFATATEATVESTLEALAKSITAAFKTDKKTEPSALVKLLANDTKQLEALATQRDALTKAITTADSFAASTLTAATGTGSLTTIAGTLAIFAKTTADLSKLRLVLPGDPAALSGPAAEQAKVDVLKKTLNDRVVALQDFQQNIQQVIHEGLNAGAVQDLIAGGVDTNGGLAKALASATPAQIAALNASQAAITATAKKLAANAGDAAAQAGVDAGKAVADGILQGLKDKNASLLQAMTKLADALVNQIKKDLKIHSPSRIMRDMGVHVGTGLEHGILSTHGAIQTAAAGMARSATPSIASFDMPGALSAASGSFSPGSTTTHNQQREIHAPVTIHAYGGGASADQIAAAHGRMIAKALR